MLREWEHRERNGRKQQRGQSNDADRQARAVSEEVGELRNEIAPLRTGVGTASDGVRQEMRDGFIAVNGKIAGVHRRIHEELDKRNDDDCFVATFFRRIGLSW